MPVEFDISPEKQAGVLRFWQQQYRFKPQEVRDVDLSGRTAIVTGANGGVGLATCLQLLDLGLSKLIMAVRNESKGNAARETLISQTSSKLGENAIEVWTLDLSVYDQIINFAERAKGLERLDIVNLNAGFSPIKQIINEHTGHDEIIQVNYLSTALLAVLLLPVIKEKQARGSQPSPSRISFTSSEVAAWTKFKERTESPLLAALDTKVASSMMESAILGDRMLISKLLGQFFVAELARRVPPSVVVINAASPGVCHDSEFNREVEKTFLGAILRRFQKGLGNTCAVGARMMTDALVNHGEETHGQFLSFQKVVPMAPIVYTPEGKEVSERLWKETMAELSFAKAEDIVNAVSEGKGTGGLGDS
ncbi:WW domain-containing oxidoreductase [Cytospora mali]|uniref:WW domain-containing oxidoreductase n=1 Tax=Cytospora mali TaxID=578113 RepID=A0A194V337_CYTMA|nr:WW domain-containing oxidoreductase [Valsa mali var. pyri (nom. inval.)]